MTVSSVREVSFLGGLLYRLSYVCLMYLAGKGRMAGRGQATHDQLCGVYVWCAFRSGEDHSTRLKVAEMRDGRAGAVSRG